MGDLTTPGNEMKQRAAKAALFDSLDSGDLWSFARPSASLFLALHFKNFANEGGHEDAQRGTSRTEGGKKISGQEDFGMFLPPNFLAPCRSRSRIRSPDRLNGSKGKKIPAIKPTAKHPKYAKTESRPLNTLNTRKTSPSVSFVLLSTKFFAGCADFREQVAGKIIEGKIMILPAMILPLVRSSVRLRLRRAVSSVVHLPSLITRHAQRQQGQEDSGRAATEWGQTNDRLQFG